MSSVQLQRPRDRMIAVGLAVAFFAAGGLVTWLLVAGESPTADTATVERDAMRPAPMSSDDQPAVGSTTPPADVEVTLDADAVQRAGITYAAVVMHASGERIRVPGTVEPNAYREVLVTPLVNGRVEQVHVQLGDRVRQGHALATVFSPDLADAQTRFLSMRASIEAEELRLKRTDRLLEIGAASRQEFEEVRARTTQMRTELEGARARLVLLGLSRTRIDALRRADQISALVTVPSPSAGVIIERTANTGLNIDQSSVMFKVSDLSRVWVIANLYERSIADISIKDLAIITTPAFPDLRLTGRVSYLDPVVDPATRTAKVRIEVENPGQRLRLQMYVDVTFETERAAQVPAVPASAIQRIGDGAFVYIKHPAKPGTFIERRVQLGDADGDHLQVREGLSLGDVVVASGSFHIRAERERNAPAVTTSPMSVPMSPSPAASSGPNGENLDQVFAAYESVRALLSQDRLVGLSSAATTLANAMTGDDESERAATALSRSNTLEEARVHFGVLSTHLVPRFVQAKLSGVQGFFCPMKKQPWAQRGEEKANPYYGAAMLDCGTPLQPGQ